MTESPASKATPEPWLDERKRHRLICIAAGNLALLGGVLAVSVHMGFVALTAIGAAILILTPSRG